MFNQDVGENIAHWGYNRVVLLQESHLFLKVISYCTHLSVMMSRHGYVSRFNTLMPRQYGRHFADDSFICIFLNENVSVSIKISLKFVPKGPVNNIPALVPIMAWRHPGDKPLSERMVASFPTHICVTRLQWVNALCDGNPFFRSLMDIHESNAVATSNDEWWCFPCYQIDQTVDSPIIWDAMTLMWHHCNVCFNASRCTCPGKEFFLRHAVIIWWSWRTDMLPLLM